MLGFWPDSGQSHPKAHALCPFKWLEMPLLAWGWDYPLPSLPRAQVPSDCLILLTLGPLSLRKSSRHTWKYNIKASTHILKLSTLPFAATNKLIWSLFQGSFLNGINWWKHDAADNIWWWCKQGCPVHKWFCLQRTRSPVSFSKKKKIEQQRNSTQKTRLGIIALPSLFMCVGQVPPENLKRSGEDRNVTQRWFHRGWLCTAPSLHPPRAKEASPLAATPGHRHQLPPVPSPFIYIAEQTGSSVKGGGGK